MPVLINFKICDNAKECNGIMVCPTKALFWDAKKKSIGVNNKKCINCGMCEKACEVNAIFVAKNKGEYKRIKKEIDDDPRTVADLLVDRYGAQPIHPAFLIPETKFQKEVLESDKLVAAEIFCDDSIMCLLKSISIKELLGDYPIKYRKVEMKKSLADNLGIKKLPSLLFFKKGKILGKVEGYYGKAKKEIIKGKIKNIFEKYVTE